MYYLFVFFFFRSSTWHPLVRNSGPALLAKAEPDLLAKVELEVLGKAVPVDSARPLAARFPVANLPVQHQNSQVDWDQVLVEKHHLSLEPVHPRTMAYHRLVHLRAILAKLASA